MDTERKGTAPYKLTLDQTQKLIEMRAQGQTWVACQKELEVPVRPLQRIYHEAMQHYTDKNPGSMKRFVIEQRAQSVARLEYLFEQAMRAFAVTKDPKQLDTALRIERERILLLNLRTDPGQNKEIASAKQTKLWKPKRSDPKASTSRPAANTGNVVSISSNTANSSTPGTSGARRAKGG